MDLLYCATSAAFPVVYYFASLDYDSLAVRLLVPAVSVLVPCAIVLANDCVTWFNMILFFHSGVEVALVDVLVRHALSDDTNTEGTVLSWMASVVIFLHLLPFFVVNDCRVLLLLAVAGVGVNSTAAMVLASDMLLQVASSSAVLLVLVLNVACLECVDTSLLSRAKCAIRRNIWIYLSTFEGL